MSVGTCTCDRVTREVMKASRDGSGGSDDVDDDVSVGGGVDGGVGGRCFSEVGVLGVHRMTCEAFCARYEIICRETGKRMNWSRAALFWAAVGAAMVNVVKGG